MSIMENYLDDNTKLILRQHNPNSSRILGISDLAYVKTAMVCVKAKWVGIGTHWEIDSSVLDTIKKTYKRDVDSCFTEMIAEWLTNGVRSRIWREVVIVISARGAGENPAEAEKLAKSITANDGVNSLSIEQANGVDDREIGKEATIVVKAALDPISYKWKHIGIILGLPYGDLKVLQDEDVSDSISSVVERWLKKEFHFSMFGVPSWRRLVEAIGSRAGGDNTHQALEVARQHPSVANRVSLEDSGVCHHGNGDSGCVKNGYEATVITNQESDSTELTPRNVRLALKNIVKEWDELAEALGISHYEVVAIETNHRHDVKECLKEVVNKWFEKKGRGPPSWEKLCEALRSQLVNRKDVADSIEEMLGKK